ncbi:MAG: DUF559 domain-containing protein [Ilumatobacter sp.]|nr:DUF559 domain-containing protein [Ilumatobacter sp.]
MRLLDVDALACSQHGLITQETSGLPNAAWHRAVRAGQIEQLHPGVARLAGTPRTPEQAIAAAVFAAGPGALASHRSAARLWGVPRPDDDPVDVIVAEGRRPRLEGVVVHRPRDRGDLRPQRQCGIACTNVLRTACDLGAVDATGLSTAVGHVLATERASLDALEAAAARHSRRGRPGIVALRRAIDEWSIDSKPADSILETAMSSLIERYTLPAIEFHPIIEGRKVDFRVCATPIILECDGWAHHGPDRRGFERDRTRDVRLIEAGWIIVRFTYRSITSTPALVAARIEGTYSRWAGVAPPDAA